MQLTNVTPILAQAGAVASRNLPSKWLKFAEQPCLDQMNWTQCRVQMSCIVLSRD